MPEVMGQYRFIVMGGPVLTYWQKPYYAKRQKYLPMIKRTVLQILIQWMEGLFIWINVDPTDLLF